MVLPSVIGLPVSTQDSAIFRYERRIEREGEIFTIEYEGHHGLPLRERVTIDGRFYSLIRRTRSGSGDNIDNTIYELRPEATSNRLAFIRNDTFPGLVQDIIRARFQAITSDVNPEGFDRQNSTWAAYLAFILEGSPTQSTEVQRANIRQGTNLLSLLWSDLVETDSDDEIGFQQAAQILYDYGIGVTPDGVLFNFDDPLDEVEIETFISVSVADNNINYDEFPIGCRYENPGGEIVSVSIPHRSNEKLVQWVSEIMPNRPQAILEIELQRRLLKEASHVAEFIVPQDDKLMPRSIVTYDNIKYLVTRTLHVWDSDDIDTTEIDCIPMEM